MTLEQVAREWGLPLAMLVAFAWAILKRWLVTGAELKAAEDRYERERVDRIAAQTALEKRGEANAQVADNVAKGFEQMLEALEPPDPYDERLEGRRRAR